MFLILLAFPVLTSAFALLWIDRHLGGHFFDQTHGGQPILWQNLFWFFGHPEVYVIVLPAFGIVLDVLTTFTSKTLYGYKMAVLGIMGVVVLSFLVWAHHEFVSGWAPEIRGV